MHLSWLLQAFSEGAIAARDSQRHIELIEQASTPTTWSSCQALRILGQAQSLIKLTLPLSLPEMYTSIINKLAIVLTQSITGKNFQLADSAMIRQECLVVSVVQNQTLCEDGCTLYERSVTSLQELVWRFSETMHNVSLASINFSK